MAIIFDQIPSNLLVPGVYTEANFRNAAQGTSALPRRALLVGQRLSTGAVATGVPYQIFSPSDADSNSGPGSMLAEMAHVFKASNKYCELWGIGLDDNGSGVPATGTITITGPSTAAGTLALLVAPYWVGSELRGRYLISVASGDTATTIAAAIVTAITDDPYRSVSASNVAGVVTINARHDGTQGNSIVATYNYFAGEKLPAGVGVAIVAMASGATNSNVATAIAAMGDAHTTHFAQPWTDATTLTAVETEMTRRWGGTVQRECHAFAAASGSLGTLTTLGDGRNSEFSSIFGSGLSPSPVWVVAAEIAAIDAASNHPGRPLRGKLINCMLAPAPGSEFDGDDRQQLLAEGIATYTVNSSGKCILERLVTTYQEDSFGNASSVFRDRQVAGTAFAIRYDWRTYIGLKYPDFMHAADGSVYAPGLPIVTPATIKAEFASRARNTWTREEGWMENPDQFLADIVIERTTDGMDMIGAPDLINGLHIIRTRFDFKR
jgi:phage tail sheath gpL-like